MSKRLKSQCLAASQDVVCKIRQLPFLVPLALLLAILFYLLRVALAILLPVVRVCLAPLPRTFEANLPVNGIASDLLPMIIMTAFALACGLAANGLSRMISRRLKDLLTITAPEIFHRAAPSAMEIFSRKTPLDRGRPQRLSMGSSNPERPHIYA